MKTIFSLFSCAILSMAVFTACENAENFNKEAAITTANVNHTKELAEVGKIYVKDNLIYVNEPQKGIHIIDNTDPTNPREISFVKIEGNLDVAMKGDYLYADSYADLLVMNMKTKKQTYVKNVFSSYKAKSLDNTIAMTGKGLTGSFNGTDLQAVQSYTPVSNTGTAGSMARFAIVDNYLYVIDNSILKVYDITDQENPKLVDQNNMNVTVETIFPYEDKLFIGGTDGMFIYDNTDPVHPKLLSKFEHLLACDPVVVDNDIAYITLRNGTPCREQADNLLQIVDVQDPKNPTLIKEYPMHNPHGLSIANDVLYICDGTQGLKVYDVSDVNNMKVLSKAPEVVKAYDVINIGHKNNLVIVGKDGIYQYDNANPSKLTPLSKLEIYKAS